MPFFIKKSISAPSGTSDMIASEVSTSGSKFAKLDAALCVSNARNHLFEPESQDRKSWMIGRTTPTGHVWARREFHGLPFKAFLLNPGLLAFLNCASKRLIRPAL